MIRLRNLPRHAALWLWAWADAGLREWQHAISERGVISRPGVRSAIVRAAAERARLEAPVERRGQAGVVFTFTPFRRREAA